MKTGIELIAEERIRQIEVEGHTIEDDMRYNNAPAIAAAGVAYAMAFSGDYYDVSHVWPWKKEMFKPAGSFRDLVKAGALIAAAIDRLDDSYKEIDHEKD